MKRGSYHHGGRVFLLVAPLILTSTLSLANVWSEFKTPYSVQSQNLDAGSAASIDSLAIGSYANGCLAGAEALPLAGLGYQVIRTSRGRYFGHPQLINFVENFSQQLHQSGSDDLLIADISMPRGGNFVSGHSSHQIGLDVDIWFRQASEQQSLEQRETPDELSLVDSGRFGVNGNWQAVHGDMIRIAAENPQVARVFVNPAIKQKLCEQTKGASVSSHDWLGKVRPWWGHKIHMHVRLACPQGDGLCQNQKPPKSGTGCEELGWWKQQVLDPVKPDKSELAKGKQQAKPKPKRVKIKPEQCQSLLN
ncbi:penicillin-insensitive murein endopeptidase [Shewanella sp. UCD-KL12]|uniref:penicillin-insensitive murein endopeptidase n=1 Tax=Shewanella sp. UCD-KL12 TaxID=1917163 RepID=UPI0009710C85|nr:penicillin-insensitive murein endopeptidase [Shewanella sp. UCD-KL12]